ncbi:MAG: glycosyltransferase, partial [Exilispira sp.]
SNWILKTIGTRESYVDPFEIYKFAKSVGMDYVTITDHNSIDGILKLKEKKPDDTIIGVELTTYFPEDGVKIHLLVYNFEPEIFNQLNNLREDIYKLRDFILEKDLFYSVAHPFYSMNKELNITHLEKLVLLFNNFEVINGGRNNEINSFTRKFLLSLNMEKMDYLIKKYGIQPAGEKPWQKIFTAGSDDHTGLFVGTSYNYSIAKDIDEFLLSIKENRSLVYESSIGFESHAFQILKIASDFYKHKSQQKFNLADDNTNDYEKSNGKITNNFNHNFSIYDNRNISLLNLLFNKKDRNKNTIRLLINTINKLIFERKKLSLKEKIAFKNLLKQAKKKNDQLKIAILSFIITIDNLINYDINIISKELFETINSVIDISIKKFIETITRKEENLDIITVIYKTVSLIIPLILSLPYISSVNHLWKDRKLIDKVNQIYFKDLNNTKEDKNTCMTDNRSKFKKILWFTDTLIDLNGVSVTLQNIGNYSSKMKKDLQFITSLKKEELEKRKLNFDIINFEPVASFTNDIYVTFEVKIPSILKIIEKVYDLNPDEIIISTPGPVGLAGLLASKILNIHSKMIFHTDFSKEAYEILKDETFASIVDFLLRIICNLADEILANNNEYLRILKEKGYDSSKLKIFKRGIDLNIFRKLSNIQSKNIDQMTNKSIVQNINQIIESKNNNDKNCFTEINEIKNNEIKNIEIDDFNISNIEIDNDFIMLYTGRISKDKNLDFIIDIFKEIVREISRESNRKSIEETKKEISKIKFIIAGDGPYLEELKRKYLDLDGLIFTGMIENKDLVQYYSLADLFVFPSITDTFGMSVLEAAACGLPAIVSNIGGPKEIIKNNKTGFVLNIDKKLWKTKIYSLIDDKKNGKKLLNYLSKNAIDYVREKFDIEKVIDYYFIKEDINFFQNNIEQDKYKNKNGDIVSIKNKVVPEKNINLSIENSNFIKEKIHCENILKKKNNVNKKNKYKVRYKNISGDNYQYGMLS